eukprot:4784212-Alexandrium_andersonii.AAC.1
MVGRPLIERAAASAVHMASRASVPGSAPAPAVASDHAVLPCAPGATAPLGEAIAGVTPAPPVDPGAYTLEHDEVNINNVRSLRL